MFPTSHKTFSKTLTEAGGEIKMGVEVEMVADPPARGTIKLIGSLAWLVDTPPL